MIHIQVFETNSEYNTFTTNNTDLESGVLYYIKEDNTAHYYTNNIDGIPKVYNFSSDATDTRIVLNDDVFGWTASSAEANQAGTFVGPALTNSYSLPVIYSSSNTDIATVNQSGEVNAISNGTATITAAFAGNEQYYSKTVSYELTVAIPQQRNLTDQEFGWTHNVDSFTVTEFGPFTDNPLINIYNLPVTYVTDENLVSIDANGNITTINNGSTWVWAKFAGNEQYYPKEVWFNLDIVVPQDLTNNEFSIDTNSVTITDPNNIVLPTLTNTHNLPVTYGSSDTSVATVNNNGQVTVVGNGNATIIISFAGNETYKSKTLTYDIHVAIPQELTDAEFGWPMTVYNYDSSTDNFVLLNNTHNLPATYTVSDENVLIYDSESMVGFIQGRHDGTATITATFAGNEQYKPKTAVLTVNVDVQFNIDDADLSWSSNSAEATETGSFNGPTLTNRLNLPVTYSSSDTTTATVNANGQVTIIQTGTADISATFAGDNYYNAKTVTYSLYASIPQDVSQEDLVWSASSATVTTESSAELPTLTNALNLSITYTSSDTSVATVDNTGKITVVGNGTTTISAVFAGNAEYNPKTISYELTVAIPQELPTNEFGWSASSATVTTESSAELPTLINSHELSVAYESSNTSVASINDIGKVTVIANGTTTISATFSGNETYKAKTITYELTVAIPVDVDTNDFRYSNATATATQAGSFNGPTLINTNNLSPIIYESSDTNVATVNSNGQVTVVGNGTTSISAHFDGNSTYKSIVTAYTLTVAIPQVLSDNEFGWTNNTVTVTESGIYNGNPLINTHNLPVVYSTSDDMVTSINNNGQVEVILSAGQSVVTITAEFAGNAQYVAKTVSYTLNIDVQTDLSSEELSFSANSATATDPNNFTVPTLTNVYDLPLTYTSSNTSVATVNQNGNVTIAGNGTATITASFAGNSEYNPKTISYELTVAIPGELPASDFEWSASSATVTTESSAELPTLTNNHNLSITYTSSDTSVATVDNTGKIIVVGNGTTTISAVFDGNAEYNPKTISYELTVAIPQELPTNEFGWSASSATVTTESSAELPTLTNTHNLSVTYESSDTNVATINDIGKVTVIANGTTTISATFSGNETYKAKTVTYTLTVAMPVDVPAGALDWSNGGADVKVYPENGGVVTTPTLTNTLNLPVTYSSENSNIATVDSNGQVTVVGDGYTYIYAIFAGNEQYSTYTIRYKLIADTSAHIITSTSNAPVMTVMKNKNFAANSDFMTENEAKAVTNMDNCFKTNTQITSFDEFQYFTGVTQLNATFCDCTNMTSVILPESLTHINTEAFANCKSLTTLNIPRNVRTISSWCLQIMTSLTAFTVDSNNNYFAADDGVLFNKAKTRVIKYAPARGSNYTIPNTVTSIADDAFSQSELKTITIPASVTSYGPYSFWENNSTNTILLTDVYVERTNPATISNTTFNRSSNIILHVPVGCKSAYKAANYWKDFKQILEPIRNLTDAELGWSASSTTVTTESPAELPTLNNTFNLTVAYSSSDTSVATIDQSGSITVVGNGTTTITASFAGNVEYYAKNVTYTLEVAIPVELTNQEFAWSRAAATAESAGIYYEQDTPTLINTHSLSVTYSSSNTSVATVDANGQVTIIADGTTTITANFAGNASYKPKTAGYLLTVQITRQDVSDSDFYWNPATVVISSSGDATRPVFVNNLNLPIRYVSSAESVATIDQSGNITITGNGTTNLQAIFSGNQSYNAKTRTAMFVVNIPEPQVTKVITSQSNPAVMSVMHNAGLAANQDYMTDTEAAAVTNSQLEGLFYENTDITTFNEFQYFTGITSLDPKYVPATDISEPLNNGVFQDSTLTEITLPPNLTEIGENAFYNCTSLETINMPEVEGVTVYPPIDTIGNGAFGSCESLDDIEAIVHGDGTTTKTFVGVGQFEACNIAYSPDLSLVTDLGDGYTFSNCPNMTGVQFSEDSSLTTIPEGFMQGMDQVKDIYIPDNIVTIEENAFCAADAMMGGSGNCALGTIYIGAGVETIGYGNFANTPNLTSVTFGGSNLKEFDGTTFGKPDNGTWTVDVLYTFLDTFLGYNTSMNLNIDPSRINGYGPQHIITMTNDAALMNAINANHNIVHESNQYFTDEEAENTTDVQFVGTFSNNTNITQFDQFKYFTGITTIASKTVSGTTTGGFEGCTNLASIVLPSDIHSFENKAFANCSSLTNFDISNLTLSEVTGIGTSAFAGSAIPNAAEIIGGCTGISYLGDSSFSNLKGTQDNPVVIVPNNITTIGSGVFAITDLQTVQVDGTWTQVPVNPWLEEIYIGPNINEIKVDAFKNQIKLSRVVIYKNTPPIINTNIWNDVKNTVKIYVPNVSAYTSSSSWSAVRDRIYDISAWKDADGYTDSFDPSNFWPNVHTP